MELATGEFPYAKWDSPFQQIKQVAMAESPKLPADQFSAEFCDFIAKCLNKNFRERSKYSQLLEHPFLGKAADVNMAEYVIDKFGGLTETWWNQDLEYFLDFRHELKIK